MSRKSVERGVIVVLAVLAFARAVSDLNGPNAFIDLQPMYCAGATILSHGNPYAVQPLRHCEIAHGLPPGSSVVPAPVPGYVLAVFALLAALPYDAIEVAFALAGTASFVCIVVLTARLAKISPIVPMLVMLWTVGYRPVNNGQLSIFATLGIVVAAFAVQRKRWWLAAAATGLALIQPQFGLAVAIALAFFFPRVRVPLAAVAVLIVGMSFAMGPAQSVAYLTTELPRHAAAEVFWPYQYSLTWLLAYEGIGERAALAAGSLSTIVLLILGTLTAGRFARNGDADLSVLGAAAFATLFGSFIHIQQIESIMPAAVVLLARARAAAWMPALAALLLGAGWSAVHDTGMKLAQVALQDALVGCGLFVQLVSRNDGLRAGLRIAAGVGAAGVVLGVFAWRLPAFDPTVHFSSAETAKMLLSGPLASDQWKTASDMSYRGTRVALGLVVSKAYVWLGIVLLLSFSSAAAAWPETFLKRDADAAA